MKNGSIGCLFIIIILVIGYWVCGGSDKSDVPEKFNAENFKTNAYIISKTFIKATLKAPSTADFPFAGKEFANYIEDSTFIVQAYVDAQNSFGAMIRTNYKIKMKYDGGNWADSGNWSVLDINTW